MTSGKKEGWLMEHLFSRTEMMIGREGLKLLQLATVTVFGIGGVGSFTVEALARSGIGHLILVDHDRIQITNVNRQIHALMSTIGRRKVDVMKERILDINPDCRVTTVPVFVNPDNIEDFFPFPPDFVVDAVDHVPAKISIIKKCMGDKIPVISSMGTGNKLDPGKLCLMDIARTHTCPLARVIRRELKKAGILKGLIVVSSTEMPVKPVALQRAGRTGHGFSAPRVPGSMAFVPSTAGLLIAGEVIRQLLKA